MNHYCLHLLKGVSRAEYPISVLDHLPALAQVMVHWVLSHVGIFNIHK
jgi:hypothetical protein